MAAVQANVDPIRYLSLPSFKRMVIDAVVKEALDIRAHEYDNLATTIANGISRAFKTKK